MPTAPEILSFSTCFALYSTFTIFAIGTLGNLVNIGVLTTLKIFRSNQCAFYLIVESIVNTLQLIIIFMINILPIVNGFDPGNVSNVWCKIKTALPQVFRLMSTSMVCFAAFDQYLSTNPQHRIRQISSLRLARYLLVITICLWTCHTIPYAIFNQVVPTSGCILTSDALTKYYSFFYYPVLNGFLPILSSTLFSIMAYRNVRHIVRRQVAVVRRRLDRQFTAMIFIRVICFVLFLLPYSSLRIYILNDVISPANAYPYAIEQLSSSIIMAVSNLNYTMSFYIFLASSARYRRQVKNFLTKKCWRLLKNLCYPSPNEVHPVGGISHTDSE